MRSLRRFFPGRSGGRFFLAPLLLLFLQPSAESGSQVYRGIEEDLPKEVEEQPIPFSHRKHAAVGLGCVDCHATVEEKAWASLPDLPLCISCHDSLGPESLVERMEQFVAEGEFRWVRVYEVPDYVFFHHGNHLAAGLECETCHGPVAKRDVLAKEVSTSMVRCMNCHAERKVANHCHFCHSLGH